MRVRKYGAGQVLVLLADDDDTGLQPFLTLSVDWFAEFRKSFTRQAEIFEVTVADADASMRQSINRAGSVMLDHIAGRTDYLPHLDGMRFEVIDRTPPDGPPLVWVLVCDKTGRRG